MTTFAYCILRDSLAGGTVPLYAFHAGRECAGIDPSGDERAAVLVATKEQMEQVAVGLAAAGRPFKVFEETDGKMAGCAPVISFSVPLDEKHLLEPIVGHLDKWRPTKSQNQQLTGKR